LINLSDLHFAVVEDQPDQREEILNALQKAGLDYANCVGEAASFSAARDLIDKNSEEIELVFLDLNLPRDERGNDLDKDLGYQLLDWIHADLNVRPNVHVRVIIVSGEYSDYGVRDKNFREKYDGTLVAIAPKNDLPDALAQSLAALNRDGLLERMQALKMTIIDKYLVVMDPQASTLDRLEAGKEIACQLLINEGEFRNQTLGSCGKYSDRLNNAIKDLIELRFEFDPELNRRHPSVKHVSAGKSWGDFVWRGLMYQHLYAINTYYNQYKHVSQQPYISPPGTTDEWTPPKADLDYFNDGQDAAQIVQILVKELLRWYLPWHAQVYVPWFKTATASGVRKE